MTNRDAATLDGLIVTHSMVSFRFVSFYMWFCRRYERNVSVNQSNRYTWKLNWNAKHYKIERKRIACIHTGTHPLAGWILSDNNKHVAFFFCSLVCSIEICSVSQSKSRHFESFMCWFIVRIQMLNGQIQSLSFSFIWLLGV